ncbi:PHP domain-containing protein [Anaerosporobacter sp.]|uniref:PHP domain-containing protein n=1 Tax=Anaerosporobacter sp. TaxID=1872529 RepID=UPI00286EF42E|nr:PHP domain-containing protein [Anaerosporobacter sp.]
MIDMHVHSYWSDGEYSPYRLVQEAKERNLEAIVLADHDTFAGKEEMLEAGKELDFPVSMGIEISCMESESKKQIHILGYGLDEYGMSQIEEYCLPVRNSLKWEMDKVIYALEKAGYPLDWKRLYQKVGPSLCIYKQMIMEEFIENGLCTSLYGGLYKELFKTGKDGLPPIAKLEFEYNNPIEAVGYIHELGGVAVLAHPGQYDSYAIIPELVEVGLAGIEVYHPKNKEQDIERCLEIAKRYNLHITGGSDFHGRYGEGERIGAFGVLENSFSQNSNLKDRVVNSDS